MEIKIVVADESHGKHSETICAMIDEAAQIRGTGIAKRDPKYVRAKMEKGDAVIALDGDRPIGFCYIENWEDKKYVVNSGLIVHHDYRNLGLAKSIKKEIFRLSKKKYPQARLFGITTSMAVMKINSELGYHPVTFSELTQDDAFWKGCQSCTNYDILTRTNRKMCLCTGMVCDLSKVPDELPEKEEKKAWDQFTSFLKGRKKRIQSFAKQFPKLKNLSENE